MITPNLVYKLVAIFFLLFGFLNIYIQKGINKIVGLFMIYYAYINIISLRNKGKKRFKLALLKINIVVLSILFIILLMKLIKHKDTTKINKDITIHDLLTISCVIIIIIIIANYISIKNYKLK